MIEYGKSENGFEFPMLNGELLSWSINLYMTLAEEQKDYPRARTVIRAMQERRPAQLDRERYEMLKGSFDRMFGHNARKCLEVIEQELKATVLP